MIIPKECKRLAEVDFPISVVSQHSVREKAGPTGHISTLHLWWARRPLGSSRAMLLSLLLPDPLDPLCPIGFKVEAKALIGKVLNFGKSDSDLRVALLKFIGEFASWNFSSNTLYLNVARGLVNAAYEGNVPLVGDPFAGGGSIPLEALRLGCDSFSSDLNPVASLIEKVMLEDIPRYGSKEVSIRTRTENIKADCLADGIRLAGTEIQKLVEDELGQFYPPDPDGARPIAYLWARTVRCESPNCGAEIPLVRSFWLSKKSGHNRAIRFSVQKNIGYEPNLLFEVFSPTDESEVPPATVSRAKATCPVCHSVLAADRVRAQLESVSGGADVIFDENGNRIKGALLLAVVTLRKSQSGKGYRLPTQDDYLNIFRAEKKLSEIIQNSYGINPVPDEPTPVGGGKGASRAFSVRKYGINTFGDLFSVRQKLAMITWVSAIRKFCNENPVQLHASLALAADRVAMCGMSLTNWNAFAEKMQHTFGRQALPIVWDFAEVVSLYPSPGSWPNAIELVYEFISNFFSTTNGGQVQQEDATRLSLPDETCQVVFTDPPYYDAVPYSDLSDFFFVWLKRILPNHPLLLDKFDTSNCLTPKLREIVQDDIKIFQGAKKDKAFFENMMAQAFREARRILQPDGIASVVFAHKTTEGWEALLSGMTKAGWTITASWPISTENETRLRARESAALAASIHLVCRPRPADAIIGDWGQVSRELPRRVREWMIRLQNEGVRGADLVFACIGPALEIYSRYSKVVDAEDREIPLGGDPEAREPYLRGYLAYVWEVVGRTALEQVLGSGENTSGALEEDARLTALFLWTMQTTSGEGGKIKNEQVNTNEEDSDDEEEDEETPTKKAKGGYSLIFDVARRFAQPLGIHLPDWENRIIETDKGIVRLYPISERAKQLFGEEGAQAFANDLNRDPAKAAQLSLFPDAEPTPRPARVRATRKSPASVQETTQRREATTLDRLHAAMLLQKSGQSSALRALLQEEDERGSDFMRLANALSALYPRDSEEKRLLDALLVNIRR